MFKSKIQDRYLKFASFPNMRIKKLKSKQKCKSEV